MIKVNEVSDKCHFRILCSVLTLWADKTEFKGIFNSGDFREYRAVQYWTALFFCCVLNDIRVDRWAIYRAVLILADMLIQVPEDHCNEQEENKSANHRNEVDYTKCH